MPYINYDESGKITGQFACKQYDGQIYTNLIINDIDKFKVVDGDIIDISQTQEYIAEQKANTESILFTEARECIEKLRFYKLLYPSQANEYDIAITARYTKLDSDLLLLDGE